MDAEEYYGNIARFRVALFAIGDHGDKPAQQAVSALMATLDPPETEAVRLRFGLDGRGARTFKQTGVELNGLSGERVRQLEMKAFRKFMHPDRQLLARDMLMHASRIGSSIPFGPDMPPPHPTPVADIL